MSDVLQVKFMNEHVEAYGCEYMTPGSAGIDLRAFWEDGDIGRSKQIIPGILTMLKSGISVSIPHGYFGMLAIRSSAATKNEIILHNQIGIIDSDYRGEIHIPVTSRGGVSVVEFGARIAQLIIVPYKQVSIEYVTELSDTDRGNGGFGSTGVM